jgi:hypothetical protein
VQIMTMKKDKQQSPIKAARKAIQESLLKTLKSIAGQLQKQGIHTDTDLEKESKKLAKKITKGAKVDHPAASKETAPATEAKTPAKVTAPAETKAPAKAAAPAKAKPAAKAPAPKAEKVVAPAAPVKPAAPKTAKAASKKTAEKK